MGVPEGKEREKEEEWIFEEIMAENFLNLMKDMNINNHEAQWTSSKMNLKRSTLRHIIIKLSKDKEKIDKLNFVKIKTCVSKDTINRVKGSKLSGRKYLQIMYLSRD